MNENYKPWWVERFYGSVIGKEVRISKWFIAVFVFFVLAGYATAPNSVEDLGEAKVFAFVMILGVLSLVSMIKTKK